MSFHPSKPARSGPSTSDEAGLRASLSSKHLLDAFHSAGDMLVLLSADGLILEANRAAKHALAGSRPDVVGRLLWEVSPCGPDYGEWLRDAVARASAGESVLRSDNSSSHTTASGPSTVCVILEPIPNQDGQVRHVLVRATTRHLQLAADDEIAIRYAATVLEAAAGAAKEPVFLKDLHGRYRMINEASTAPANMTAAEALGLSVDELFPARFAEIVNVHDRKVIENDQAMSFEYVLEAPSRSRSLRITRSPIHGPRGNVIAIAGIGSEITELRRAEEAERRTAERLAQLRSIDRAILAGRSPREVSRIALESLAELVPFDCGGVCLFDFEGDVFHLEGCLGAFEDEVVLGREYPLSDFGAADLASLREGRIHFAGSPGFDCDCAPMISQAQEVGLKSYLRVPLGHQSRLMGAITLGTASSRFFTGEHIEIIRDVAGPITIAIEHARLFEENRNALARLEGLSRRLIRAQEDERRRVSQELHDEIGQTLTALRLKVESNRGPVHPGEPESVDLRSHIDECLAVVRGLARELRPSVLDDLGLVPALRSLVSSWAARAGIHSEFLADPAMERDHPDIESACYRIAQEAVTNVVRHAGASRLRLEIRREGDGLCLLVTDDGQGFDLDGALARAAAGESLGVLNMRERAMLFGGRLEAKALANGGTELRAYLPRMTGARAQGPGPIGGLT